MGRVIESTNAGLAKDEYEGVNFAIPSNLALRIFDDLKRVPASRQALSGCYDSAGRGV
jgi:S1-C subfamily serine protease